MAKIPGVVFTIVGIGVYLVTAFAPFEKTAKILFTVIASLLIIYGIGGMAIDISNKRKKAAETKKTKFDYMPQASPQYTQQQMAQQQAARQQHAQYAQQQRQAPRGAIGFCSVCGTVARADDNFCGKCGSRLR